MAEPSAAASLRSGMVGWIRRRRRSSLSALRSHLDSQRVRLVGGELSPQLTAFFTSAPILASSAAVNSVSAKATGHTAPSSRFAASLKPNVAYLVLNFFALWKLSLIHISEPTRLGMIS